MASQQSDGRKGSARPSKQAQSPSPAAAASSAASAAAPSPVSPAVAPVSSPMPNSSFNPHLPPATSLIPGASIHATLSNGGEMEGTILSFDPTSNLLCIERSYPFDHSLNYANREDNKGVEGSEGKRDYALINTTQARIEVLPSSSPATAAPSLPPLSIPSIRRREQEMISVRMEEKESIGVGVSMDGQKLFDTIRKTTPCVWSGTSFIVLESVRVQPPYTAASCQLIQSKNQTRHGGASGESVLQRVKKIVEAERNKLKIK